MMMAKYINNQNPKSQANKKEKNGNLILGKQLYTWP